MQFVSWHFCASARHLSAGSTASDESWSGGGTGVRPFAGSEQQIGRASLDRTAEGGCPYMGVSSDGGVAGAGGRLTCLSVRCLSSYLIFSASSSDKQAAAGSPSTFAGARPDGLVRRP